MSAYVRVRACVHAYAHGCGCTCFVVCVCVCVCVFNADKRHLYRRVFEGWKTYMRERHRKQVLHQHGIMLYHGKCLRCVSVGVKIQSIWNQK